MSERAESYLNATAALIETYYRKDFTGTHGRVSEAAQYALDAGGKRLRPGLVLAAAEVQDPGSLDVSDDLVAVAAAFEHIHTYSLIHDDLPVMDNDAVRRGRPSCHVAFGTDTAVRAGALLLVRAFASVSRITVSRRDEIISILEASSGNDGMVGGQALDILGEGTSASYDELVSIHTGKTAALIRGAVLAGLMVAEKSEDEIETVGAAGAVAGLAFQIVDDLLDVESTEEAMGKPVGADAAKGKRTYPAVLGAEESRKKANLMTETSLDNLRKAGKADSILAELIRFILVRSS